MHLSFFFACRALRGYLGFSVLRRHGVLRKKKEKTTHFSHHNTMLGLILALIIALGECVPSFTKGDCWKARRKLCFKVWVSKAGDPIPELEEP